jgi:hypothetical protein
MFAPLTSVRTNSSLDRVLGLYPLILKKSRRATSSRLDPHPTLINEPNTTSVEFAGAAAVVEEEPDASFGTGDLNTADHAVLVR